MTQQNRFGPVNTRFLLKRVRLDWWLQTQSSFLIKRLIDLCLTIPAFILLMPLFAVIALAIKLCDGGPVLYWQRRIGVNGKVFPFPKFRSMIVNSQKVRQTLDAQNEHGAKSVTFKMKSDPRITSVGKFLRRASLDELPQLWCVLTGDMSLVGPRPPLPEEVACYTMAQRERLTVLPGLTCIWQVNGRSEVPFPQQVFMDIEYIRSRSLFLDLQLLGQTLPAVLKGRGAY